MSGQFATPDTRSAASAFTSAQSSRQRLRTLDACLTQLEEAHERNEVVVGTALAARLRPYLGRIEPGARIADAIGWALREQEQYLAGPQAGDSRRPPSDHLSRLAETTTQGKPPDASQLEGGRASQLGASGARELTDRIRGALDDVAKLLLEAHDRRAWSALGYSTWGAYVSQEFRFTKQRSFQLLDHARFLCALEDATGRSTAVDLPERVTRDLKAHRNAIVEAVRVRAAHAPDEELPQLVRTVIKGAEWRRVLQLRAGSHRVDVDIQALLPRLCGAIDTLAHMPPAADVAALLPRGPSDPVEGLREAAAWLATFARAWARTGSLSTELEAGARDAYGAVGASTGG